jgi:hypothetical protein
MIEREVRLEDDTARDADALPARAARAPAEDVGRQADLGITKPVCLLHFQVHCSLAPDCLLIVFAAFVRQPDPGEDRKEETEDRTGEDHRQPPLFRADDQAVDTYSHPKT